MKIQNYMLFGQHVGKEQLGDTLYTRVDTELISVPLTLQTVVGKNLFTPHRANVTLELSQFTFPRFLHIPIYRSAVTFFFFLRGKGAHGRVYSSAAHS